MGRLSRDDNLDRLFGYDSVSNRLSEQKSADLGVAYEAASVNAVVSSTLDDAYSSPSPFTLNSGEPSKFGVKLGASVGVECKRQSNDTLLVSYLPC
ncbi:MAG: hypothetical protein ACI82Z_002015 [Cellvibrionaceae bacterium]